jgi:plastocyanin
VSFSFDEPGLHHYDCSFHATDMQGTVLVADGAAAGS